MRSALVLAVFAGIGSFGCDTSTTADFPTPDFQVRAGERFAIRAGDLGFVAGTAGFLYVSVQSVGVDTRCPPGNNCETPGFLELTLELETSESQGAIRLQIPPDGTAVGTFQSFEIRVLEAAPPGSGARILPTDYAFLMTVSERQSP